VSVSVIVPCFNQAHFLAECLESLLSQTFASWEAIVVDDASTQGDAATVVRELEDPRIRVIRHETNRGAGASRNSGFRDANAELILPLDCDDWLDPLFLEKTVASLRNSGGFDCAFTDFQLFGDSDAIWTNSSTTQAHKILESQWIPGAGTLMRAAVWERVGGYSEDPALLGNEDWDFWIGALEAGLTTTHIAEPLYRYRLHVGSTSALSRRYAEFRQRDLMYGRHQAFFDRYRAGGKFRAMGYINSAAFAWMAGERRRAAAVAWQGLRTKGVRWPFLQNLTRLVVRRLMQTRYNRLSRRTGAVG
jgi:glycosyltransferase involved in cell wall biosynthesis